MRFHYTDAYTYNFPLTVKRGTFYVWAEEALAQMNWEILRQDESYIEAVNPNGGPDNKDILNIAIHEGTAYIESYSPLQRPQAEYRQKENLLLFLEMLSDVSVGKIVEFPEDMITVDEMLVQEESAAMPEKKHRKPKISMLQLLFPRGDFIVTPSLIIINVVLFILMASSGVNAFHPETQQLIDWGANVKSSTLDGQWWRLITSCFLHAGVMHLVFNMYALLFIGLLLEPVLGRLRFFVGYMISGIGGSLASAWWNDFTVSAGASGAIFGLYGIFLAIILMKVAYPKHLRGGLLLSGLLFIGYNLMHGFLGATDSAAHVGGLASGLAFGFASYPAFTKKTPLQIRKYYLSAISTAAILIFALTYFSIPNDIVRYQKTIDNFSKNEELALSVIPLLSESSPDKQVSLLKSQGVDLWDKNIQLLHGLKGMPPKLDNRIQLLLKYCELRKSAYELLIRAIQEDQIDLYEPAMEEKNYEIQMVLSQMQKLAE